MHNAEIIDASAKLEEQRRRNRLAQRRRRERQRNRAASVNSINNDSLPTILSEGQEQASLDKTWEFAIDSDLFDASIETQDDVLDQCLQNSPHPDEEDVHISTDQPDAIRSAALISRPESAERGTELQQDSYSRLLAIFPRSQLLQNRRPEGSSIGGQQSGDASDFMQLSTKSPICYSSKETASTINGVQTIEWSRSEPGPSADGRGPDSAQEARFERIREFVEDAGFESLDAMMAAYYSASFNASGNSRPAQSVGRSRRLRGFLSAIHRSHTEWGVQERSAYREEIVRAAEGIYADELSSMIHGATANGSNKMLSLAGSSKPSAETSRVYIAHRLQNIVSDQGIQEFMRKDRKELQDTVN
ncbi:hypothetical protein NLG97_g3725 [Lecanicillium saksenae]|uniref:Uncharacterized protein n=1 Tax=Lecanicillium saksenae TaxID=468837 RepID=A0ACC1QZZ3_9HYPO|nr:hypothetical protein NLG97_g3725 [Lecanicillium saksenae]